MNRQISLFFNPNDEDDLLNVCEVTRVFNSGLHGISSVVWDESDPEKHLVTYTFSCNLVYLMTISNTIYRKVAHLEAHLEGQL